jgi:hypothetical protein
MKSNNFFSFMKKHLLHKIHNNYNQNENISWNFVLPPTQEKKECRTLIIIIYFCCYRVLLISPWAYALILKKLLFKGSPLPTMGIHLCFSFFASHSIDSFLVLLCFLLRTLLIHSLSFFVFGFALYLFIPCPSHLEGEKTFIALGGIVSQSTRSSLDTVLMSVA